MTMDEMAFELDNKLLERMQTLLAPYGMEPEEVMAAFARWCAAEPELAREVLLKWQAEQNNKGGN